MSAHRAWRPPHPWTRPQIGPYVSIGPHVVVGAGARVKHAILLTSVQIKVNAHDAAGPPAAASEVAELRRVVQLQLSAIKALEARVSALEEAASAARGGATAGSSAPASSPSALNDDHDDEDNDEDVGHPESHVFGDDELRSMMVHSLSVAPRTLVLSPAAGRVGVATTPTFKLVLVGGGGAGCTTLLQRLAQGRSEFPSWAVLLASEADLQQTDTRARSLFLSPFLFSQAAPQ